MLSDVRLLYFLRTCLLDCIVWLTYAIRVCICETTSTFILALASATRNRPRVRESCCTVHSVQHASLQCVQVDHLPFSSFVYCFVVFLLYSSFLLFLRLFSTSAFRLPILYGPIRVFWLHSKQCWYHTPEVPLLRRTRLPNIPAADHRVARSRGLIDADWLLSRTFCFQVCVNHCLEPHVWWWRGCWPKGVGDGLEALQIFEVCSPDPSDPKCIFCESPVSFLVHLAGKKRQKSRTLSSSVLGIWIEVVLDIAMQLRIPEKFTWNDAEMSLQSAPCLATAWTPSVVPMVSGLFTTQHRILLSPRASKILTCHVYTSNGDTRLLTMDKRYSTMDAVTWLNWGIGAPWKRSVGSLHCLHPAWPRTMVYHQRLEHRRGLPLTDSPYLLVILSACPAGSFQRSRRAGHLT